MATCSTSSARAAASPIQGCRRRSALVPRPAALDAGAGYAHSLRGAPCRRRAHPSRRDAYSPCRGRLERIVEAYLRRRGITALHGTGSLRFHPRCYYRPDEHAPTETWPAMIAAVTNLSGDVTGAHRTWLDPVQRGDKAPIDTPRRAMGDLLGHAVRFGVASEIMAAGEGIETMLSLRCVSARHADGGGSLGGASRRHPVPGRAAAPLHRPRQRSGWRWRDDDTHRPGAIGRDRGARSVATLGDFNEDLRLLGVDALGRRSGCRSRRRTSPVSWSCWLSWNGERVARRHRRRTAASDRCAPRVAGEDRAPAF